MIKINLKQLRGAAVLAIIKDTKGNYESVTISGKPFFIVTDLKAAEKQAQAIYLKINGKQSSLSR